MTGRVRSSDRLDDECVAALRAAVAAGEFPGVVFEQAMEFLLTDGVVPASGLPVDSFLRLDDWMRRRP